MARITIEDCLQKINNRFIIVHMAQQRTRQLLKGSQPLVHAPDNRQIVVSLREIAAGKVTLAPETYERLSNKGLLEPEQT
ncbi:MAG: DNA-directed RNA polymerase subunit omega [Desulfobacterota bacterium]|nr:DNA-directed RNA polymerase subunit omega [Thermodesulfobacteriota bacterium]